MKIAIGIATTGRRDQLTYTLQQIAVSGARPLVFVCPASSDDIQLDQCLELDLSLEIVWSQRGVCSQRNAILKAASDVDFLVFMDDDFYPAPDYLNEVEQLFRTHSSLVVATNHPALDGATGPGISHEDALVALRKMGPLCESDRILSTTYGGYGCNMAFRMDAVRKHGILFDEALPLYGWLEDIDFSRRLAPYGRIASAPCLRGVHLATKRGRSTGVRLGYSQIANPFYMVKKGSVSVSYAAKQIFRNLSKNVLRSLWPEPWVDRRGRLKGNLVGIGDLIRARLHPRKILEL